MGYKYADGFHSGHLRLTYRGWYPVIDFSLDVNDRHRQQNKFGYLPNDPRRYIFVFSTHQPLVNGSLRVYIPWSVTNGAWRTTFVPRAEYRFSNDEYRSMTTLKYQYFQSMMIGFTFSSQLSLAVRDIYPRWGYSVRAHYSFPVLNHNIYSTASVQASCYMPGLLTNHGLLLTAGYQWQGNNDELRYNSFIHLRFPRGYITYAPFKLMNATLDYTFPIWYPDLNISWLAYFKRLRATVFGDFAQVENNAAVQRLFSAGADLLVDFHLFHFGFPVSAGVRYAQPLLHTTAPSFHLLLNISI
jgi:hypothetical protein